MRSTSLQKTEHGSKLADTPTSLLPGGQNWVKCFKALMHGNTKWNTAEGFELSNTPLSLVWPWLQQNTTSGKSHTMPIIAGFLDPFEKPSSEATAVTGHVRFCTTKEWNDLYGNSQKVTQPLSVTCPLKVFTAVYCFHPIFYQNGNSRAYCPCVHFINLCFVMKVLIFYQENMFSSFSTLQLS